MQRQESLRVALVGRQLPDNENLGLGYLQAALADAHVAVERFTLNSANDIAPTADAILSAEFDLTGVSIPDGGSALLALALGEMLHRRGYAGKIVAGGPFATLARHWLLERYCWLDAVVRFAGELPLVHLVGALMSGRAIAEVGGVTTRSGDGPPAPVGSNEPLVLRPQHAELPELMGRRVAHLQATRGCLGRCGYCGPAALQGLEREEGRRLGIPPTEQKARGIGGIRRRPIDNLCDEMAALYQHGVRYFYLVDEHCLPYQPQPARAYLSQLRRELRNRYLDRIGIGCMLKPERLTSELLDDFIEVGLVRAFLGLEFATREEGRRFRRHVEPASGRELMAHLDRRGIACVANLMLVHPESTRHTLRDGIEYLESVGAGIVETTRMMVYHGTELQLEMQKTGRLTGNPLRYGYQLEDPVAQRFSHVFARLRLEALGDHSLAQRTHEVALTLALAERLHPNAALADARDERRQLEQAVRALTTSALRRMLTLAEGSCASEQAQTELVQAVAEQSTLLSRKVEGLALEISTELRVPLQRFAPLRAAAASTLAFAMMGSMAAACGGTMERAGGFEPGSGGSGGTTSIPNSGGAPLIPSSDGRIGSYCAAGDTSGLRSEISRLVAEQVPCFSGSIGQELLMAPGWRAFESTVGLSSSSCTGFGFCGSARRVYAAAAENVISELMPPDCALRITISGGTATEADRISSAMAQSGCEDATYSSYQIQIDASGNVVDVTGALPQATLDCMRTALHGLSFPCLTSTSICPEYCIIE